MRTFLLSTLFALGIAAQALGQCNTLLESCANDNPGAMAGYTLVGASYADLDQNGGRLKITMYKGNTYRFLACKGGNVPALVIGIADQNGQVLATNLTEDQSGVYKMLDITCNATGEYLLVLLPYNGTGCCGVVYAMK
ncbi:MAG: hypothetical protein SFY70_00710 [Bacteroidia bacterium]|nr:hypothetical protein [Bacteroidia bacterium]